MIFLRPRGRISGLFFGIVTDEHVNKCFADWTLGFLFGRFWFFGWFFCLGHDSFFSQIAMAVVVGKKQADDCEDGRCDRRDANLLGWLDIGRGAWKTGCVNYTNSNRIVAIKLFCLLTEFLDGVIEERFAGFGF